MAICGWIFSAGGAVWAQENPPKTNMAAGTAGQAVGEMAGPLLAEARRFAVVTSPIARRPLARLLAPHIPDVPVLSFLEIPDGKPVDVIAVVGGAVSKPMLENAA